jgi:hypothetical protein
MSQPPAPPAPSLPPTQPNQEGNRALKTDRLFFQIWENNEAILKQQVAQHQRQNPDESLHTSLMFTVRCASDFTGGVCAKGLTLFEYATALCIAGHDRHTLVGMFAPPPSASPTLTASSGGGGGVGDREPGKFGAGTLGKMFGNTPSSTPPPTPAGCSSAVEVVVGSGSGGGQGLAPGTKLLHTEKGLVYVETVIDDGANVTCKQFCRNGRVCTLPISELFPLPSIDSSRAVWYVDRCLWCELGLVLWAFEGAVGSHCCALG